VAVEKSIGLLLPTREEMAEIEASSRLYQEDGGTFMTATVLVNADGDLPTAAPVTFVLTGDRLVTIRYVEPKSFAVFAAQAERQPSLCPGGAQTFLGLLDAVIDRTADILERTSSEVEAQSRIIFSRPRGGRSRRSSTAWAGPRSSIPRPATAWSAWPACSASRCWPTSSRATRNGAIT
jgi:magnesium transporter